MKTIGHFVSTRQRELDNNFLLLRLIAATLVVYGHSFNLAAACLSCQDIAIKLIGYEPSHGLGVKIFFVVSGFLVFASFNTRNNLASYLKSRALRIFPGLIVCVAIMALLVGPIYTSLPILEYLRSPSVREYFFSNASLLNAVFELPGVHFSATRDGSAVNGSLWTIPLEFRLYLLIALFGALGLIRSRWAANTGMIAIVIFAVYFPSLLPLIQPNPGNYSIACFFLIGAFLYNNKDAIPLDWQILALLILITALSAATPSFNAMCAATLAYAAILFAYSNKIRLPSWIADYSYGIYLYSFPIQQMIASAMPEAGPYKMMALAIPLSWLAGALSWHFIEKPFLALKKPRVDQAASKVATIR